MTLAEGFVIVCFVLLVLAVIDLVVRVERKEIAERKRTAAEILKHAQQRNKR